MKVSIKDKAMIKQAIVNVYLNRSTTINEDHRHYIKCGLSQTRLCFDLLAASLTNRQMMNLYKSYNDEHLLTATKRILLELLENE